MTKESIYDQDKLTDTEKLEIGFSINRKKSSKKAKYICHMCNKKVENPIHSYKIGDFEFVPENEIYHKSCLDRKINAIMLMLQNS